MIATKTKSHTVAIFPILIALKKFIEYNSGKPFIAKTPDQQYILDLLPTINSLKYSSQDIQSFISENIAELNKILKENGFSIELSESDGVGVITICKIMANWFDIGRDTTINYEGTNYKAFLAKEGVRTLPSLGSEILMMEALNFKEREFVHVHVFIEKTDTERSGLELFKHVYELHRNLDFSKKSSCKAVVPITNVTSKPDISWLKGMKVENSERILSHIMQENFLELTKEGISAKSATGGLQALGMTNKKIIIDQPFNIWVSYEEPNSFPLFAAYVAPDSWKKAS